MKQRLFQTLPPQGFPDNQGFVTFVFPTVPQGLVWSGTIAPNVTEQFADLTGIVWTLYKNNVPYLTWQEYGIAVDVQAIGQETVKVVGQYIGPVFSGALGPPTFHVGMTWTGWSDDAATAEIVAPRTVDSTRGMQYVTNLYPQLPSVASGFLNAVSSTTVVYAGDDVHVMDLWQVNLNVSAANSNTTAGTIVMQIKFQARDGFGNKTDLCTVEVWTAQDTAASQAVSHALWGYRLPASSDLIISSSAGGTGLSFAANANVVMSIGR